MTGKMRQELLGDPVFSARCNKLYIEKVYFANRSRFSFMVVKTWFTRMYFVSIWQNCFPSMKNWELSFNLDKAV